MARLAVFASGTGSNFSAIADVLKKSDHTLACLIYDRRKALVRAKASAIGVPLVYVSYAGRSRQDAEKDIVKAVESYEIDIIALAGFMRIFTSNFVSKYQGRILNVHPALLPKYPGAHGIEESYHSEDTELGVTVHLVDDGVDTGPILCKESFTRSGDEDLDEIEARIHAIEHRVYPAVIVEKLDEFDSQTREVQM